MKRAVVVLAQGSCMLAALIWIGGEASFAGGDPDYTLTISSETGVKGEAVDIVCGIDFAQGEALSGASWGVCSDPTFVEVNCAGGSPNDCIDNSIITPGSALSMTNAGAGPEFFSPATPPLCRFLSA